MGNTLRGSGGGENRWPLDLDTRDPEGVASFCLGLGYSAESVVNAIVARCNVDRITARGIVMKEQDVQQSQGGQNG